jgi:hypothetical protein
MDDRQENQKLNRRIAIIGAGAAGLTAAETLRRKGYRNVTVLERSNRVGGKCRTVTIHGHNYELGAGVVAEDNREVLRLAADFNVPIKRIAFAKSSVLDGETGELLPKRSWLENLKLLKELLVYRWLTWKYRRIAQPGLEHVPPELTASFSDLISQYSLQRLARELNLFFTGFGYDYFERVPAAYVLKYYRWSTLKSFLTKKIYRFPQGIQHLWTAVSDAQNVELNTEIIKICRDKGIQITTTSATYEFDELIIAAPVRDALQYLDAQPDEQTLFSKIKYVDYCTIACSVIGLPIGDGYIPSNFTLDRAGQPVYWHHRHRDKNIYTFYALNDGASDDRLIANVKNLIDKIGGQLQTVHSLTHWQYFPHVNGDTMRSGWFDQVAALQGQNHTYYVGEALNFSTVGFASEQSANVIARYF